MQVRAAALAFAFSTFALFPIVSGAAPAVAAVATSCFERMLREMGWDDAGLARDGALDSAASVTDPVPPADLPLLGPAEDNHPCNTKIQPGARLTLGCTMNFIFRDQTGQLYFGTAGHCIDDNGVGATVSVANVGAVGTVVYDGHLDPGDVPDFMLVRISPAYYSSVDPTMCHWGGPADVNANPVFGETTHIYGFGTIYGLSSVTRPRAGVVYSSNAAETIYIGFAQQGDSGAPLMTGDGNAFGVHVRSSLFVPGVIRIDPSPKYATKVSYAMAQAENALGIDLELVPGNLPFSLSGGLVPGV